MFSTGEATHREWPSIKVLNLLGMAPSLTLPEVAGSGFLHPASFASPEQLEDGPVTFRSEIYSLGCTLWYLLKGAPLAGGAGAVRGASELPAPVRELLASMVAKIPAARPADPVALEKQIQECLALAERPDPVPEKHEEVAAVVARPVQEIEPKPRPTRRWATMPLALAALLLALATLAAVVVITRGRQASSSTATLAREPHALPPPVAQRASAEIPKPTTEPKPTPIEARSDLFATRDHSPASPVVEATLPAPPHEESVESTAAMTASNSAPPDARVAAMEAALLEHFPTSPEPSPPAEGPDTDERSATEPQLMPPDLVAAEEGQSARLEVPVPAASSPPPKKTSSSASRTNRSRKTTAPLIEASPPPQQQRYLSARHYRATNVGHIFFPIWLEPQAEKPTATASPAEQPRRSRHTAGQKNTASRAAARQKSTTPGEAPPGLRGDDEERPVLPALPPDT
jgi:serine/threonine protein kinase